MLMRSPWIFKVAVAVAWATGLAGRANGDEHALEVGQSVEHLDGYVRVVDKDPERLPDLVRATQRANVWNCPTQFFHECLYSRDLALVSSYAGVSFVRQSVRDEWAREKTEDIVKDSDEEAAHAHELVTRALHRAGLTPYEVLEAATRLPAEYFGPLGDFGTVEVGKRADLILLNANPLRDLDAAFDRVGVMVRRAWLPRSVLDDAMRRHAAAIF